jgi:3-oxoacyl-[acyl-carrier protein] reductase
MTNLNFQFQDKTVVITGGAQGIGLEIVRKFLAAGARVAIWDYSAQALDRCRSELSPFSNNLSLAQVDVTQRSSIESAAASLPWSVDILVNNAGITRDKTFAKMSGEDWDAVIATNLTGLFNVTKTVFEKFNPNSSNKRIVNISSVVALYGNFGQTNYVAAKAGVIGMTKTLAKELGRKGFTVNAIAPGFIQTAMTDAMPKEAIAAMVAKIPVNRMGQTSDIANAVLFLSSEQSSYVNGTILSVDGGMTL